MTKVCRFEDLEIWKESVSLAKEIYKITSQGSFLRDFGLKDQLRRAAVSVSSNIAEGLERINNKEFIRFLKISKGSLAKVKCQLYIALEIGYIEKKNLESVIPDINRLSKKISSLIKYLVNNKKEYSQVRSA